jgi:hypothetical protein
MPATSKIDELLHRLGKAEIPCGVAHEPAGVVVWVYHRDFKQKTFFSKPLENDPETASWPDMEAVARCLEGEADRFFGREWREQA